MFLFAAVQTLQLADSNLVVMEDRCVPTSTTKQNPDGSFGRAETCQNTKVRTEKQGYAEAKELAQTLSALWLAQDRGEITELLKLIQQAKSNGMAAYLGMTCSGPEIFTQLRGARSSGEKVAFNRKDKNSSSPHAPGALPSAERISSGRAL